MNKIIIKDLELFGFHGVLEEEKKLGQKFLISLELTLQQDCTHDDLETTVNYALLCQDVKQMFEKRFRLIESVVNYLCETILQNYPLVQKVEIELKKPWAPIMMPLKYACVKGEKCWHTAFIGLGSNLGNKSDNLDRSIAYLAQEGSCQLEKVSSFIETEPVGYLDQDLFINGVVQIKTYLSPKELMALLLHIEARLGRERTIKNGPRTMDMDILLYDQEILSHEDTIIPHPRMHERLFVMEPLAEIAPYVLHPIKGKRIYELLDSLK